MKISEKAALAMAGYTKAEIEAMENVKAIDAYIQRIDEMIERKRKGINTWL